MWICIRIGLQNYSTYFVIFLVRLEVSCSRAISWASSGLEVSGGLVSGGLELSGGLVSGRLELSCGLELSGGLEFTRRLHVSQGRGVGGALGPGLARSCTVVSVKLTTTIKIFLVKVKKQKN